jgi:hypothetical protein
VSLRVSNPYGKYQNINKKQGIIGVIINNALRDNHAWDNFRKYRQGA